MTNTTQRNQIYSISHYDMNEMALSLAEADNALRAFTSDQVDAVIDTDGKAHLLLSAQEHLIQKERWLDSVIESAPDVITVVDRGGTIISQNRAVNRVLGYESAELIGTSLFKLIHDEDLPEVHSAFFNVIEGITEHATVHFNLRVHDGTHRVIEATVGKVRDGKGANVVFSMRPISHASRKVIEIEHREAQNAQALVPKDRFLAMLAHELRTPMMPVLLGISEMQEDGRFAEAAPVLAMMRRNIELQALLLEELMDFASVGQHKVRLRPEPIDAHEAVCAVLEICRSEINAARIDVNLDLKASNNLVLADSLRLQQIMWNLVRNAIKFSPPGSSISITSANETPGTITLEFIDHGTGIASEFLPLVFDPFQQGDRLMNQQHHGGLGLGMFIAKGLAEAQDGTLVVSSEGLGLGSTFCLILNLASPGGQMQGTPSLFTQDGQTVWRQIAS